METPTAHQRTPLLANRSEHYQSTEVQPINANSADAWDSEGAHDDDGEGGVALSTTTSSPLGFFAVVFLTVNATLGAGLLNIPYAFSQSGGILPASAAQVVSLAGPLMMFTLQLKDYSCIFLFILSTASRHPGCHITAHYQRLFKYLPIWLTAGHRPLLLRPLLEALLLSVHCPLLLWCLCCLRHNNSGPIRQMLVLVLNVPILFTIVIFTFFVYCVKFSKHSFLIRMMGTGTLAVILSSLQWPQSPFCRYASPRPFPFSSLPGKKVC